MVRLEEPTEDLGLVVVICSGEESLKLICSAEHHWDIGFVVDLPEHISVRIENRKKHDNHIAVEIAEEEKHTTVCASQPEKRD